MESPLQILNSKLNLVHFICDDEQKEILQNALKNVINNLDDLFCKMEVYQQINYYKVIKNLLDNKFVLLINDNILKKMNEHYNACYTNVNDINFILINSFLLKDSKLLEKVITHEMLHCLKRSMDYLQILQNGQKLEIKKQQGQERKKECKKINLVTGEIEDAKTYYLIDSSFFDEGYTELIAQKVKDNNEDFNVYKPQTTIINFLNEINGGNINNVEFLQGELTNHCNFFGEDNLKNLYKLCSNFQKEFDLNYRIDYLQNLNYKKIIDFICNITCQKVCQNPEYFSLEQIIKISSAFLQFSQNERRNKLDTNYYDYSNLVNQMISSYSKNHFENDSEDSIEFTKLIKNVISGILLFKSNAFLSQSFSNNFTFKQKQNGQIMFSYKDSRPINLELSLSNYVQQMQQRLSNECLISTTKIKNDLWQITVLDNKKNKEILVVGFDKNNSLFFISNGEKKQYLDFKQSSNLCLENIKQNYDRLITLENKFTKKTKSENLSIT